MASGISLYIKNDSIAGVYPYIHKKITIDDVVVLDEQVSFTEADDALKLEYASVLQSTLADIASSISASSFEGNENISKFHQISRLLSTIASNIPETQI